MAKEEKKQPEARESSLWSSAYQAARNRPVTTMLVAAGVGAVAGAELLTAALLGGAATLLFSRKSTVPGFRRTLDRAQQRLHEWRAHHEPPASAS